MTQLFANNATTTLASGITDVATSCTVATGAGALFPSPSGGDYFLVTFATARTEAAREVVKVTARSGDVFTIVRAQEGTTGTAFLAGATVDLRETAGTLTTLTAGVGRTFNLRAQSGAVLDGVADMSAAIAALYATMLDGNGVPDGTLLIDGPCKVNTALVFDLGSPTSGSTSPASTSNPSPPTARRFHLKVTGVLVVATGGVGSVVTVKNGWNPTVELRFGTGGASADVGFWGQNLTGLRLSVEGDGFAGTLWSGDQTGDAAKTVTVSTVDHIRAYNCGQAVKVKGLNGFGVINDVWDVNSAAGSVFDTCADVSLQHWENYASASVDNSLLFTGCNSMNVDIITVGGVATESLLKIIGGDFGSINRIRASRSTTGGTSAGVKLVDVTSLKIGNVQTFRNAIGLQAIGSNVVIKEHHSLTSDSVALQIEGDGTIAAPVLRICVHYRSTVNEAVKLLSTVTGGFLGLSGYIDTPNTAANGATNGIDSAATGMIIDVAGLTFPRRATLNLGINVPTAQRGNLRNLARASINNDTAAGSGFVTWTGATSPLGGTLSALTLDGSDFQNPYDRTMHLYVPVRFTPTGAATAFLTTAIGPRNNAEVSLADEIYPISGPVVTRNIHVILPPYWFFNMSGTGVTIVGTPKFRLE